IGALTFALIEHAHTGPARTAAGALRHAHLLGPDDVPVQADIRIADGGTGGGIAAASRGQGGGSVIRAEKRGNESAALAVQFELHPEDGLSHEGGQITLQTCLLPERTAGQRPYLLSLELARHRLMLFLNKLEDWALFDLPATHPVMQRFEQARTAFTDAVVRQAAVEAEAGGGGDNHTEEADL